MQNDPHDPHDPTDPTDPLRGLEGLDFALLEPPFFASELEARVLEASLEELRRQRRGRFFRRGALLAAIYLLGLATGVTLLSGGAPGGKETGPTPASSLAQASPSDLRLDDVTKGREPSPDELEAIARVSAPQARARFLQRAGDLHLLRNGNVDRALSCYARALDLLPAGERTRLDAADTWLLASLKKDLSSS
jgi:hypothetical protein